MARPPAIEQGVSHRLTLNIQSVGLTDDQILRLSSDNEQFEFEISAQGELIIMSPAGAESGWRNSIINRRLGTWVEGDGSGLLFDSSTGFRLPNGALRAPDAAWVLKSRWLRIPREQRVTFPPMCPDFVIELRSPSNRLGDLSEKMQEYSENGARLGWLFDPLENCVYVYRPGQPLRELKSPTTLSGETILPGFEFDFREILRSPE